MARKAIIRSWQLPRVFSAVLREIDILLQMLYSYAHRESLSFHRNAFGQKLVKGIACAMPYRKHNGVRFHFNAVCDNRNRLAVFDVEFFELMRKQNLTAEPFDFFSDAFHRGRKSVAPDMRLGEIFDIARRAVFDEIS